MHHKLTSLLILAGLQLLQGCNTMPPMGLTRSEWEMLPPERQAELRAEQYRINAAESARRDEAARERAAAAAAAEQEARARLDHRRSGARYRDVVIVTIQGGTLQYRDRLYLLQPVAFELVRGERRRIGLVGVRPGTDATLTATQNWWVSFSEDGNTVTLNDSHHGAPIRLVNTGGWEEGTKTPLTPQEPPLNTTGMIATVRYKPAPGMPQRVILENR